jgi:hypothetical protein
MPWVSGEPGVTGGELGLHRLWIGSG